MLYVKYEKNRLQRRCRLKMLTDGRTDRRRTTDTFIYYKLTYEPSAQVTRIDVYETLCPKQVLVHKGGKIKNWGGECRDVTPTKLQSQNIFKESTGGGGGSG